jgi:hypothetical protein
MHRKVVADMEVGWTRQSPGCTNGRGKNRTEQGIQWVKGHSRAIWKTELVRYTEINR